MKRIHLLLLLNMALVIMSAQMSAQLTEHYFSDNETKEGGSIHCHLKYQNTIIFGGNSFETMKNQPVIIRIDTSGNALWNTGDHDTTVYSDYRIYIYKLIIGKDDFIYAYCMTYNHTISQLWKVDPTNGTIVWKTSPFNIGTPSLGKPRHLIDFDYTKFIITYPSAYDGSVYTTKLSFVSKANGSIISTHTLGKIPGLNPRYGLCLDTLNNIYYSIGDSIIKLFGVFPDSICWKVRHTSASVGDYHHFHFDVATASLFAIGMRTGGMKYGRILKTNPLDGSLVSTYNVPSGDAECQDVKVANNHLYVSWRHIYVGGGIYRYWTTKYDMITAAGVWNNVYNFSGVGTSLGNTGGPQAAMSLDVDMNGDVYLTGYYGSPNYGPGKWGILKLNGTTGNAVYEKTITTDSVGNDELSNGMAACVINNTPHFLGNLETYKVYQYKRTRITFVKLEPVTGNIKTQKYIEGKYQFPSKTMAISKHQKNQTIVFKQTGRMIGLEMYDFNKNLMWERVFSQEYILFAGALAVAPDGDIYFSAYSKSILDSYPYYAINVDSMYVYHLDSSGVVKTRYSFFIGIENAFPVEIHAADNNVMLIYQINNTLKYRIIASSQLSPEINLLINHSLTHHGQNYCFDNGNTKARLIGTIAGINRYLEINKTTLSTNYLDILPTPMNKINFTQMIDSNFIVYCGRSSSDRESISLYNTSLKDTIWTKTWPANGYSQALKCALDSNNNIYLMSQYDDDILVRSLSASDGSQHWQYSYAGAAGLVDGPIDILYDKHRKHIIVSGYETDSSNVKQVIIITLDTLGAVIGTIRKTGDLAGDNHPLCSNLLPDGSIWIGGNLNINPYGLAGFILEIDSSIVSSVTNFVNTQTIETKVYPNPFSSLTTLEIGKSLQNARLLVFNTHGRIVKEMNNINGQTITIFRDNLPAGLYFMQLTEGNELITVKKIIIVN